MIFTLILGLLVVILPILGAHWFRKVSLSQSYGFLPFLLAVSFASFCLIDAVLFYAIDYGVLKLALIVVLSSVAQYFLLGYLKVELSIRRKQLLTKKVFFGITALSFLLVIDSVVVVSNQGWFVQEQDNQLKSNVHLTYPFNTVGEKHTILTNALIRKGDSPYLAGSQSTNRSLWYHFAAPIVAVSSTGLSSFSQVHGCILATSILFYLVLLTTIFCWRPSYFSSVSLGAISVVVFILCHHDIFSMVSAYLMSSRLAIQADGGWVSTFLPYASVKFSSLTDPAAVSAMVFALLILLGRRVLHYRDEKIQLSCEAALFSFCFVCSAEIGILFLSAMLINSLLVQALAGKFSVTPLKQTGVCLLTAAAVYWLFVGVIPIEAFSHTFLGTFQFTPLKPLEPAQWLTAPISLIGISGMIGIVATIILFDKIRRKDFSVRWSALMGVAVFGTFVFFYVVTGEQLRQFYAVLATVFLLLFVMKSLPNLKRINDRPVWRFSLLGCTVLSLALHVYFLNSYIVRGSHVRTDVNWADYFRVNEQLAKQKQSVPTIAATGLRSVGLKYPIAMAATSSFSRPAHALDYAQTSQRQRRQLAVIQSRREVFPYLMSLGYRALVWGPVEQAVWGDRIKDRFVDASKLILRSGTVSLFQLTDKYSDEIAQNHKPGTVDFYYSLAKKLEDTDWQTEAVDNYYQVLVRDGNYPGIHMDLGKALTELGDTKGAIRFLNTALERDKKNTEALSSLGMAFMKHGDPKRAVAAFEKVLELEPKNVTAYNNVGALLILQREYEKARKVLNKAVRLAPKDPQLHLNLGRTSLAQLKLNEAKSHYEKALLVDLGDDENLVRREVHFGLGDVHSREGKYDKAYEHYTKALALDKKNPGAHVKVGQMLARLGELDQAFIHFRTALKINPRYQPAQTGLLMLDRLRKG